jgi:hypothetical protein
LARDLGYLSTEASARLDAQANEVEKMLASFLRPSSPQPTANRQRLTARRSRGALTVAFQGRMTKRMSTSTILTVRLDAPTRRLLERAMRLGARSRSDVVREALAAHLGPRAPAPRPIDVIGHLAGCFDSGVDDLGTNHRDHVRKAARARLVRAR